MITLRINKRNSTDADDAEALQTLMDNNEELSIFTYYVWGNLMGLMFYGTEENAEDVKDTIKMYRRMFSDGGVGIKLHGKLADDPEWLKV
jgi:hypothetical protein